MRVAGVFAALFFSGMAFGQLAITSVSPISGPKTGATTITITGTGFMSGATVFVGSQVVTSPTITPTSISCSTPSVSTGGVVVGVTVVNPDLSIATKMYAFVYDYSDVAENNPFYPFVMDLALSRVTAGCGAGKYCPDGQVDRAAMAVFIETSEHSPDFLPPQCVGLFVEPDLPCPGVLAPWAERLFNEGITAGCGLNARGQLQYCASESLRRVQMAVFIEVAKHGYGYVFPQATTVWDDQCAYPNGFYPIQDVPVTSPFAPFVYQMFNDGVTGGCGCDPAPPHHLDFCPNATVTRSQMAVFLVAAFSLP